MPAYHRTAIGLGLLLQAFWPVAAHAADRVQPLRPGINHIALQAGSPPGMAVLAHRENFNAHGFDVLTLYAKLPTIADQAPQWQIVPLFDATGEHLELRASGGADCLLHDFRLLRAARGRDATLVLAERELGESFAASAKVTFRFFRLRANEEGEIGRPVRYFEFDRAQVAKAAYCDVGEAMRAELGLAADPRR